MALNSNKVYIRLIDNQSLTKQMSFTQEIHEEFLDKLPSNSIISCIGKKSRVSTNVIIQLATDPRFSTSMKTALSTEGNPEIGDLMVMFKVKQKEYIVQLIKPSETNYSFLNELIRPGEKHSLIFGDVIAEKILKEKGGYNKFFYGAPGSGKSHYVNQLLNQSGVSEENKFRITFHSEYSNSDFVGQILPTLESHNQIDGSIKNVVKYVFNPGPFTKALLRSYQTNDMVYLIIEELNRGNASAIFGDLFQLLDRIDDQSKQNYSESEYPITNVSIHKFIFDELGKNGTNYRLKDIIIPSNLTILATMNTSDQNVFTMDNAFKRRWQSHSISNDIKLDNNHSFKKWFIPGTNVSWEVFLSKINEKILENKIENTTSEDKRLGKYFVNKTCLTETVKAVSDCIEESKNFSYKVLEYIWNDVCKFGHSDWFDTTKYRTLEELIEGFTIHQLGIFISIKFND
jgi:hypothetical protein